ncbi:MAG: tRNA (N(6)-L-threonylcarbamoyladenosine(37)-C(2))-methylthiotransferase MtaB [Alphaproteobacteria bacterium]|nr:tRNA (N(6)-L-threonylcarbamoyladenosine(37)-C(2))-methylthiotransferase MtaB [Alphaproteobacteria bacterium]
MSTAAEVITFGCRLNALESEVLRKNAAAAGLTDAVIINTCAVTAEAERQARQAIRRLRRERPSSRIVVTGCAAQIHADSFAKMSEVDAVLGNHEKMSAVHLLPSGERVKVADILSVRETASHLVEGFDNRTRAFVQVQNGCDHRCTFCIIPYGRGNSRSVPMGAVVEQVRTLVASGYREVVLTGVDVTSYGGDLPGAPALGQLARRLLAAVPELERLRLTSLDPAEMDRDLWSLLADEPRLMPHLHLSLQAGDDLILKRMKRRHSRADAVAVARRARELRPDVSLGADLIAGFPTEDDAAFANTLALVEDCGLAFLHVFPFSAREDTPAARMPQVPVRLRKERAARLRAAGDAALAAHLDKQVGRRVRVLVETDNEGRAEDYARVSLDGTASSGAVVAAHVRAAEAGRLIATPVA